MATFVMDCPFVVQVWLFNWWIVLSDGQIQERIIWDREGISGGWLGYVNFTRDVFRGSVHM